MTSKEQLIELLLTKPKSKLITPLITEVESLSKINLQCDAELLKGVWELKWSSSTQPWLKQAPWLENLQVLDPIQNKGMNLLRLSGPIGALAVIAVEAELSINGENQVGVRFKKGGWIGPSVSNGWRPKLLKNINQSFPAWLDWGNSILLDADHHFHQPCLMSSTLQCPSIRSTNHDPLFVVESQ